MGKCCCSPGERRAQLHVDILAEVSSQYPGLKGQDGMSKIRHAEGSAGKLCVCSMCQLLNRSIR